MQSSYNRQTDFDNKILEDIARILDMSSDEISKLKEKYVQEGLKKTIESILIKNNNHKELIVYLGEHYRENIFWCIDKKLWKDKKIALLGVRRNSDNYFFLDKKLQNDKDIGFELVKSFVREGKSVEDIEKFLKTSFQNEKMFEVLFDFCMLFLKKVQGFYFDDLLKGIFLIKKQNKKLYDLLFELNIVEWRGKTLQLSTKFLSKITKELFENEDFQKLSLEEQRRYMQKYLAKIFPEIFKTLSENILFISDAIFKLCGVHIKLLKNPRKKEEQSNDIGEENRSDVTQGKNDIYEEEKCDFVLNEYEYSHTGGYYHVEVGGNHTIKISDKELTSFTTVGLKNFIKFYELLQLTGMSFLWDKHKEKFITLLNNKVGFHYPDGPGVTEGRSLKVLNFLARAIGVISDDAQAEHHKDFDTLDGVKKLFLEIKSTGKIGGILYSSSYGDSAIELFMKEKGFVNNGELQIERF